jgi:hypothetical protein
MYGSPARLFDSETGKLLLELDAGKEVHSEHAFSPDAALLAVMDRLTIRVWELATGKQLAAFEGHRDFVTSLAFSPDGCRLASTGQDGELLVWDVFGAQARPKAQRLKEEELARCWRALEDEDAAAARLAMGRLMQAPAQAVELLKARLAPARRPEPATLRKWIADLSSQSFRARQAAMQNLGPVLELVDADLRQALRDKPDLETARRIETLLDRLHPLRASGESLRVLRALQVLGGIDTAGATELLRTLAGGAPEARATRLARTLLAARGK